MKEKCFSIFIVLIIMLGQSFIFNNEHFTGSSNGIREHVNVIGDIAKPDVSRLLNNTPRAFTPNHGQLENDEVLFYDHGGAVWFTADGMWMELREYNEHRGRGSEYRDQGGVSGLDFDLVVRFKEPEPVSYKRVILKQEFVGANGVRPVGREQLSWNSNFFYGNISDEWCTNVPNYEEVWYENIYDGIDLRYYTNEKGLKYDFIVHPGAKPEQILTRYAGADGLRIDNSGNLIIKTKFGDLRDTSLYIYQDHHGIRNTINGNFLLFSDLEYGFDITGDFDRSKVLIIDPELEFSTLFSGNGLELSWGLDVDRNGSSYITGITGSTDFNTTPGANDTTYNGGYLDGYVIKFNKKGSALEYATFIGGTNWDNSRGISTDIFGNVYITGDTNSSNFPITSGAYDITFNGNKDVFISKLNWNGSDLLYSTFIGGTDYETGYEVVVDFNCTAYVAGHVISNDFPTTNNAYDRGHNGYSDGFALKLDYNGSSLIFSSYLGGGNGENCFSLDIDDFGNVYVTGWTYSDDFPTTPGAFDRTINFPPHNMAFDIFVSKLDNKGSKLLYSTYVGGFGQDCSFGIEVDPSGYAYVTGYTGSNNFPITAGAFDTTYNGVGQYNYDCCVFKLNYNASTLIYSTYIGGKAWEFGYDIVLDELNNAYIIGYTNSSDFPTTSDAFNGTISGSHDVFICQLDWSGSLLVYSTYFGGAYHDLGHNIDLDSRSNIYVSGYTDSLNFPTTPGAYNRTSVARDGFLAKFSYSRFLNISYLDLVYANKPVYTAYSRLGTYSLTTKVIDTNIPKDTNEVILLLDPGGLDIELSWNSMDGTFTKHNDTNNYLTIENTSIVYFFISFLIIDFDVTFNWTFPHEEFMDVQVTVFGVYSNQVYLNVSKLFRVENDLVFNGSLTVKGEDDRLLKNKSIVRGGEHLNWSGPLPVYEDSDNIFLPEGECNITVWDNSSNCWVADSNYNYTKMNNSYFNSFSFTAKETNQQGELYTINLSGIPKECDKTNCTFTIRIDGDNVTFNHLRPDENAWQKDNEVYVGVHIVDHGGGYVDNKSVMHSVSFNSGLNWSNWTRTLAYGLADNISVHDFVIFEDGIDNYIKWCASDSLGNGPTESEPYRVLVDTYPLFFNDPVPNSTAVSAFESVSVGITTLDNTSGVNLSSLKYSYSINSGITWSSWLTLVDVENVTIISDTNRNAVKVLFNQTFPNGTGNRIRWRGYDIAGNGPTESGIYAIIIDISKGPELPVVQLLTPENNSNIKSTPLELSWHLVTSYTFDPDIVFDIKLDTQDPPQKYLKQDHMDENLIINISLENYQTYYWTVIPKLNGENGTCFSGIWEFTMDLPIPQVRLKSPTNNSNISSIKPTFVWAVRYTGSEKLKYHVFIDTSPEFKQDYIRISETHYMPEYDLELGKTYYWQVVPWAGELQGESSEVWRFTVVYSDIPSFKLMLRLEPAILEIMPGQTKFVQAFVTNLGNSNDTVRLSVNSSQVVIISSSIYRQDTKELAPGVTGELMVMVSAPDGAKPGQDVLMVTARSESAEKIGLTVQDEERLIVNIVLGSEPDQKTQTDNLVNWWWILIFLIIFIICIILIILKRKKEESGEGEEEGKTDDITELPEETPLIATTKITPSVQPELVSIVEPETQDTAAVPTVEEGEEENNEE
jgi:hypothetical protein